MLLSALLRARVVLGSGSSSSSGGAAVVFWRLHQRQQQRVATRTLFPGNARLVAASVAAAAATTTAVIAPWSAARRRRRITGPATATGTATAATAPFRWPSRRSSSLPSLSPSTLLPPAAASCPSRCRVQARRGVSFWSWREWRGGGAERNQDGATTDRSSTATPSPATARRRRQQQRLRGDGDNVNEQEPSHSLLNGALPVSVCAIKGYRSSMEDEHVIAPDFCAVFDGHGGRAVSRYLRQNLYAELQAALPAVRTARSAFYEGGGADADDENAADATDAAAAARAAPGEEEEEAVIRSRCGDKNDNGESEEKEIRADGLLPESETTVAAPAASTTSTSVVPTVSDYECAVRAALNRVDREVQRINHWSYQGSTVVGVWVHEEQQHHHQQEETEEAAKAAAAAEEEGQQSVPIASNDSGDDAVLAAASAAAASAAATSASTPAPAPAPAPAPTAVARRTLVVCNVGDSRAVLSRNGAAVELTVDHKPHDAVEFERILASGGAVTWHGDCDVDGIPIEGTGIYRVNGNLALSRAVGDRSERPAVTADPDVVCLPLEAEADDFVVLATDGLWDVFTSAEAVAFVNMLRAASDAADRPREEVAVMLVEEALRRGTYDNVTVIIIWLRP